MNGVLGNQDGINNAVAQLLTPPEEQGEVAEVEQESPEEETLEAEGQDDLLETEEPDELEGEEEEVGDSDEDDSDEELEEEPTPEVDEDFFKVKVDGEEYEVNLEELKKGYQLEKNYTKKSQQLVEEQKEIASLKGQLEAERDKYLQFTQQAAQQQMVELQKAKVELDSIDKGDDPLGYVQKQLEVQDIEKGLVEQQQAFNHAQTEAQQANELQMKQFLQEQDVELSAKLEGWSDPEEGKAIKDGIAKFAVSQGYSEQEVNSISSAKDIIVLNKARLYDELASKRAKVRKKRTPQKATPKVRSSSPKSESTKKARKVKAQKDQFKRSGSVKDAQSLLADMMIKRK